MRRRLSTQGTRVYSHNYLTPIYLGEVEVEVPVEPVQDFLAAFQKQKNNEPKAERLQHAVT